MAKRSDKKQKSQIQTGEMVVVTFVEELENARDYQAILISNDIPSTVKNCDEEAQESRTYAVMVPEEFLDEAHVIIESQDSYDDFYDFAIDDEDDDFDSDLLDDEF